MLLKHPVKHLLLFSLNNCLQKIRNNYLYITELRLLDYIPGNTYTVIITRMPDETLLQQVKARSLFELHRNKRWNPGFAAGDFPAHVSGWHGRCLDQFPRSFYQYWNNSSTATAQLRYSFVRYEGVPFSPYALLFKDWVSSPLFPYVEYVQACPEKTSRSTAPLLTMVKMYCGHLTQCTCQPGRQEP